MKRIQNKIFSLFLCIPAMLFTSCEDEQFVSIKEDESGLPACVNIKIQVPEMTVRTRSLTDAQENQVNDLWLAIYSESGARTYGADQDIAEHNGTHEPYTLKDIPTKSGRSYIVAVANYKNNRGVSDKLYPESGTEAHPLADLLRDADTFEKFKSIAVSLTAPTQIDYSEAHLPMSGVFVEKSTVDRHANTSWENLPAVYIPASNSGVTTLDGYIHLRRLVSKVNFTIRAGADPSDGEAGSLTVRPTGWKLVNTPRISYLYEQTGNAADAVRYYLSEQEPNANYNESMLHTEIEKTDNVAGFPSYYTFSYYQFENKHTGILTGDMKYADRDLEHKNDAITEDGKTYATNTGVYRSLCTDSREPNLWSGTNVNNFASYIELSANINYTATITNGAGTITVPRSGEAVFIIHLGAIGHNENSPVVDILNDFNVERNTVYNYTVTINGVNDIVVEATRNGENFRHGAEGVVTDATEQRLDVDAHYSSFNIQLTDAERQNLAYEIVAPYGDKKYTLTVDKGHSIADVLPDDNRKFYDWVRIRPTTGENVLAAYKNSGNNDPSYTTEPWYLDDLKDVTGHPGIGTGPSKWYTVFIDEYTYDGEPWQNYVNKDDRTVLFLIQDYAVSEDKDSKYSVGKYYVRQKSIQTYYNTTIGVNKTALGVEHINESYGKRLQWAWARNASSATSLSNSNGRWNVWTYLTGRHDNNNNFNTDNNWTTAGRTWNDIIRYCNGNGTYNADSSYIQKDPTYPVPLLQYAETPSNYTFGSTTYSARSNDPSSNINGGNAYFEIVAACMNRNRDLNGDGQITGDELRWYLPAEGKYERIVLGRNSLVTPLFSTSAGKGLWCNSADDNIPENNWGYSGDIGTGNENQVQYVSSNGYKFFPEEGASFHQDLGIHWAGGNAMRVPWNIRCVRNLDATTPGDVIFDRNTEPVEKAYRYDNTTRTFDMGRYDSKSIRPNISTFMEVHSIKELNNNRIAWKFQVSEKNYTSRVIPADSNMERELNANSPCGDYHEPGDGGATWRAPNQKELMMMITEGLLESGRAYYSCTKEGFGTETRFAVALKPGGSFIGVMQAPVSPGGTFYVRCIRDIE